MTAPLSPERIAELRRAASLARLDTVPELLDEIERFQTALADAAAWVVRDVGIPVDMSTAEPPPDALRQAMYRYCFEDPDGTIHGGDLTYDELVAFVDQEARWLPVGMTGHCEDDCAEQCQGPCGVGDLGAADEAANPPPAERKVIDLMAALEQSVNDARAARKAKGGES